MSFFLGFVLKNCWIQEVEGHKIYCYSNQFDFLQSVFYNLTLSAIKIASLLCCLVLEMVFVAHLWGKGSGSGDISYNIFVVVTYLIL